MIIASNKIKVYPATNRSGDYPDAFLATEDNLTKRIRSLYQKNDSSFVISKSPLSFVIFGYYFEVNDSSLALTGDLYARIFLDANKELSKVTEDTTTSLDYNNNFIGLELSYNEFTEPQAGVEHRLTILQSGEIPRESLVHYTSDEIFIKDSTTTLSEEIDTPRTVELTGPITGSATASGVSSWSIYTVITDSAITESKISANAVTSSKIATSAVITSKVSDKAITTAKIADYAITGAKISSSAISSINIDDGAVNEAKIAQSAVTSAKIADGNVITSKLSDSAVTTSKVADSAITTAKIASGAITTAKISDSAVTTVTIKDSNITEAKISTSAVTTAKIADSNITAAKLATSAVTSAKISAGAVTTAKIADSNVTASKIATSAVIADKISANAITTTKISNGNVTNEKLANPYIVFSNGNIQSFSWTLGSTNQVNSIFGFSTDGLVQFSSQSSTFTIIDNTELYFNVIPNNYMSNVLEYTAGNFPRASIVGISAFTYGGISSISLPKAQTICGGAFAYCSSLSSISLPACKDIHCYYWYDSSIRYTGAFTGCSNLKNVFLNKSIISTTIESGTFSGCNKDISITGLDNIAAVNTRGIYLEAIGDARIILPKISSFSDIGHNGLYNIGYLQLNLSTLPSGAGSGIFGNSNYQPINNIGKFYLPNMTTIGISQFCSRSYSAGRIYNMIIPNVTNISGGAFDNLTTLSCCMYNDNNYVLSKLLTIGSDPGSTWRGGAFSHCINLKSFNAPNLTDMYGHGNFANCTALEYINIENVKSVEGYTFSGCTALKSIKLLKCSAIGWNAFNSCTNLSQVYLGSTAVVNISSRATDIFSKTLISTTGSIFVPTDALKLLYQQNSYWATLSSRFFVSNF